MISTMRITGCRKLLMLMPLMALLISLAAPQALAQRSEPPSLDVSRLHATLSDLDDELMARDRYIARRAVRLDSLRHAAHHVPAPQRPAKLLELADSYRGFNNDSAMNIYKRVILMANSLQQDSIATVATFRRIAIAPLFGYSLPPLKDLEAIDRSRFTPELMAGYHETARNLGTFLAMKYPEGTPDHARYAAMALAHQDTLLQLLPKEHPAYLINLAENYMGHGNVQRARAVTIDLLQRLPPESPLYARAAYTMAAIAQKRGETELNRLCLALSAISDVRNATLEVSSLQELGMHMYNDGDIDRAYHYLTMALQSAVESCAEMRIVQSGVGLAIIEATNSARIEREKHRTTIYMWVLAVLVVVLLGTLLFVGKEMRRIASLKDTLQTANEAREVYISRFLELCSIYMDKLNQFCQLANRKISAGKVDDLYKLTRSGKFIEEQSADFYDLFDNAFLHLYPGFPEFVNSLLKPEEQLPLPVPGSLNNDLRILALMRMGITDNSRIAELLNYSVNTIYAYRNKLRNRAEQRETFETAVTSYEPPASRH